MSDGTKIEWTEATWNPITGCSVKSPGCTNCYAMKLAGTRLRNHPSRDGLTQDSNAGPVWTGEVRFNEHWLDQPLRWKRPRMIFVCAHGDLFHESVPDEWIDRVFAVMALCPQHTFQVLTKRSDRMREYFRGEWLKERIDCQMDTLINERIDPLARRSDDLRATAPWLEEIWPLPNVWLGVSVEDQKRADERIPDLLATPAAVRWLSCEPLLGALDLRTIWIRRDGERITELSNRLGNYIQPLRGNFVDSPKIDWVVVGGESGPGARPMHPDWARSLRDQCASANVPFFFKQWGAYLDFDHLGERWNDMSDSQRGNQQFVEGKAMIHVGKKTADRKLDGRTHDAMPEVAA